MHGSEADNRKAQHPQKLQQEEKEEQKTGNRGGQTDREDVKREPLTPPKVERATEMGMIHDITPSNLSPNVWERKLGAERKEEEKTDHR